MARRRAAAGWVLAGALLAAGPGAAQMPGTQFELGTGVSSVVTLDQDRLFEASRFGQAVAEAVDRSIRALAEENRALEQQLSTRERQLTERRARLPTEEFRTLADAFDAEVQTIRRRQEERGRSINAFRDTQRQRLYEAALPIVAEVVAEAGAVAVLDSRALVLALDGIDITDRVLTRLDAELGAGDVPDIIPAFRADPGLPPRPQPRPPDTGGPPLDLPAPVLGE